VTPHVACVPRARRSEAIGDGPRTNKLQSRTEFCEHDAGCRELGVRIWTDWAEMRIAKNAWFRFAAAAKRTAF